MLVIAASYIFYGWWDWRFLVLIAVTTGCSFLSGIYIGRLKNNGVESCGFGEMSG